MDSRETENFGPSMLSPTERVSNVVVMFELLAFAYIGRMVWPRPEQITSPC